MIGPIATTSTARRGLCAVFAVSAAGGVAVAALAAASPSATAATDPCAASEVAKTLGSVATSTGNYLDTHPETNTALTTISPAAGGPAVTRLAQDVLRRQPAGRQGHAAAAAAAGQPVHQVQAAVDAAPADGPDAVRAVAGGRAARWHIDDDVAGRFARLAALCTDRGCAARRPACPAVTSVDPDPGQRAASRPLDGHLGLARSAAPAAIARHPELGIQGFSRLVQRKARKSSQILLSFSLSVTARGYGLSAFDEGA